MRTSLSVLILISFSVLSVGLADKKQQEANYLKCNLEVNPAGGENLPVVNWIDIKDECVKAAKKQIRMEFEAALAYLQMGSYFAQYDINRPGYAKFFFGAASEERSHAIKLFDYLLMRGQMTHHDDDPQLHTLLDGRTVNASAELKGLSNLLKKKQISGGLDALNKALQLEVAVTRSIKRMIKICENEDNLNIQEQLSITTEEGRVAGNDYHMVDWLTGDLLDEQLKGQRELAGRISTLNKMKAGYGQMADFLYDKKLLEELESKAE